MSTAEVNAPAVASGTALWLKSLKFHLGAMPNGEYRFTHVRLADAPALEQYDAFLRNLMTNRSIPEVLRALTPTSAAGAGAMAVTLSAGVAADLRAYFQELAHLLHVQTNAGVEQAPAAPPATADCACCPRHHLAARRRGVTAKLEPDICECARERAKRKAALAIAADAPVAAPGVSQVVAAQSLREAV